MLRLLRALMFGFVWSFALTALGVKVFSGWFFLSIIPGLFIFETLEVMFFKPIPEDGKGGSHE